MAFLSVWERRHAMLAARYGKRSRIDVVHFCALLDRIGSIADMEDGRQRG